MFVLFYMAKRASRLGTFLSVTVLIGLPTLISANPVYAQRAAKVLDEVIRGTARVAEDVPVGRVDNVLADLSKSRSARETIDAEIRTAGGGVEASDAIRGTARSREVFRLLRAATGYVDHAHIKTLEQLDEGTREAALILAKGGEELRRSVPDIAMRARLLREGGPDTVAAIGILGPDAAKAAIRLDEAMRAGNVVVRAGDKAVTLAHFGMAMNRFGDASWTFWKDYIQPHWKLWAATGALAAYLANPEYFQNAAGKLTETGFKHLTEFVGVAAAGAIRGIGTGAGTAADNVTKAATDTFLDRRHGVYAIIGAISVLFVLSFFFRRVRAWALTPLRWLQQARPDSES